VRAFLSLRNVHTHTNARVRGFGNDRRHVHSRARPFAALSQGPPFKTARAMDRQIGALFFVCDTRVSDLGNLSGLAETWWN